MIQRILEKTISDSLHKNKVIMLLGARQTGKTTMLKKIISNSNQAIWLNGDEYDIQEYFKNATSTKLKRLIGNHNLVIIDEAQRIDNIGLGLKLVHDTYPEIQIIATGSSAFELKNKTNEPLTGRKFEYQMYPLSFLELSQHHSELIEKRHLHSRLVFGSYPEVINNEGNEIEVLKLLADSYLFKDILMLDTIKKPEKLIKLLQALAFQIGSEVSYNEIGNLIGLDSKTVESYINLLEKAFIVFKLNSLNRNLRNELKLSKKIYFYDTGIRNAILNNFQMADTRQDIGALFENYLMAERIKYNEYHKRFVNRFFWRTKEQQEIDYVEEHNGNLFAFEFKWNTAKKATFSKTFTNAYPNTQTMVVTKENYEKFLNLD